MGQLAGVFFHVRALNLHAPFGAVLQNDVEVAIVSNWLIILGDLVILWLIRVEVVLAGKARRFRNGAIQRQTNLDGPLHALGVNHWQSTWQTQGNRVYVGVGRSIKVGCRGGKHLGVRAQFDVDFQAHNWVILFKDFIKVHQVIHRSSHACHLNTSTLKRQTPPSPHRLLKGAT